MQLLELGVGEPGNLYMYILKTYREFSSVQLKMKLVFPEYNVCLISRRTWRAKTRQTEPKIISSRHNYLWKWLFL